jgi:hypothetical protein
VNEKDSNPEMPASCHQRLAYVLLQMAPMVAKSRIPKHQKHAFP